MDTVTDMEAGLEHLKRGTLEHAETLLIVVEPYFKSLEAAGRILELAQNLGVPSVHAIANKVQTDRDEQAIRTYCAARELSVVAAVPFDAAVAESEWHGQAVIDRAPDAAAVVAVRGLARWLVDEATPIERVAD